jgi:hypothetical protein
MEAMLTDKFSEKVAELRKTDPLVDWGDVKKGAHGISSRRQVSCLERPARNGLKESPEGFRGFPKLTIGGNI